MKTSRNVGFSLIETLTVLSIMAIGLTVAVPSWNQAKAKRHITESSENLALFLTSGRSLAVKHNRNISVSLAYQGPKDWCLGMTDKGAACDCTVREANRVEHCDVGGVSSVLRDDDLTHTEMISHAADTAFDFDRVRGTLAAADASSPHFFRLLSADGELGLQVEVSPTGNTFICRWLQVEGSLGYRSCEPESGIPEPPRDEGAIKI